MSHNCFNPFFFRALISLVVPLDPGREEFQSLLLQGADLTRFPRSGRCTWVSIPSSSGR